MGDCLTRSELEAFVAGTLADAEREGAEEHLQSCARCREVLGHCEEQADTAPGRAETVTHEGGGAFSTRPVQVVPGYEVLDEIHRGGQGVVFRAIQRATRRMVALKVLLHGRSATPRQQHRFEREIELVASLRHPHVVRVYESGIADGRPFLAMEYVKGKTLTEHLRSAQPDLETRLRLFQKVCLAVNAAHQRGIIHRDLKPQNILVDAEGEPRILDFGLAKALGEEAPEGPRLTITGEFMGTLAYASPEQLAGDPARVDIRSDIYSLGVILFDALTGELPHQVDTDVAEMLRNIREVEPRKPSELRAEIDDELDTIVLTALAKEEDRRYQTAAALARDIDHYLAGEPLDAQQDSAWYLLRKSLRRYRVAVGVAAAFVLTLVGATIGLTALYQLQKEAREAAERTAQELEIVTDFQQSMLAEIDAEEMGRALYENLASRYGDALTAEGLPPAEVEEARAELEERLARTNATDVALDMLDHQVLERAAATIASRFSDQPLVRAALLQATAETYREIGRYQPGLAHQQAALDARRDALGDEHEATLESLSGKGLLLESLGRYDEARDILAEVLDTRRRVLGADHPDTFSSMVNLGTVLEALNERDEALRHYGEALEGCRRVLGDDHPQTLVAINNMGNLLKAQGRREEAMAFLEEALAIRRRVMGDEHPDTLVSILNMGAMLMSLGRDEEALGHFREALEGWRSALGEDHPSTLVAVSYVGAMLNRMGRPDEAEPYYRRALEGTRRTLGDDHPNTILAVHNMGRLLRGLGQLDEAEALGATTVAWARGHLPEGHPDMAAYLRGHALSLWRQGRRAEAAEELREAHTIVEAALGPAHRHTLALIQTLVELEEDWTSVDPGGGHAAAADAWRARLSEAAQQPADS